MHRNILIFISIASMLWGSATVQAADGTCGTANGTVVAVAPEGEICSTGTATKVDGAAPWRWFCEGTDGGTSSSCFATIEDVFAGNGPEGGYLTALAVDPTDGKTVFAGSLGGIYKSTDGGNTWRPANNGIPRDTLIRALTIDPNDNRIVFAGTIFGIYKSVDGGSTWVKTPDGMTTGYFNAIAIDPADSAIIYAASEHGVLKSTDAGQTWSGTGSELADLNVLGLAIMPGSPQIIFAATTEGLFTSPDGGSTWTPTLNPYTRTAILALSAPKGGRTLYAANSYTIMKTSDGGAIWETLDPPTPWDTVRALAVDPADDTTLLAASATGIYRSTDGGITWTTLTAATGAVPVGMAPTTGAIYVATSGSGILRSVDGGTVWRAANTGLNEADILSLATDPFDNRTVYAGTYGGGLFKTTNGGITWNSAGSGLTSTIIESVAIDPAEPETIYAGAWNGLFKSTDGGTSWQQANDSWTPVGMTSALAVAASDNMTVYAGSFGRVYRSTDGGSSWIERSLGLPDTLISTLAVDPATAETVYAGTYGGGVFRSTDGGATWTAVTHHLPGLTITSLVVDPFSGGNIYAGTGDGHLYRSLDGGATWTLTATRFHSIRGLAFDPETGGTIYVGTYGGVYRSTNGGESWTLVGSGLEDRQTQSLAVGRQIIHAGMYAGGVLSVRKSSSPPNGACGRSDGGIFSEQPTTGLCEAGIAQGMTGSGPWTWTCSGSHDGTDASCFAEAHGTCGPADGASFDTAPATNLCTAGIAGSVTGTGPWAWTCTGSGGGRTSECSAGLRHYIVNVDGTPGGHIISESISLVPYNDVVSAAIIPQCGYHTESVTGCNGTLDGSTFTTGRITSNCTIAAAFKKDPVTLTVENVQVVRGWKRSGGTIPILATATEEVRSELLKARSNVPWISVMAPEKPVALKKGAGRGKISYTVEKNPSTVPRKGLILVGCNAITVNQEGAPCALDTVSPSVPSFPPEGGTIPVTVTAPAGCSWQVETVSPAEGWLFPEVQSGIGTQTFNLEAAPFETEVAGKAAGRKGQVVVRAEGAKVSKRTLVVKQPKMKQEQVTILESD